MISRRHLRSLPFALGRIVLRHRPVDAKCRVRRRDSDGVVGHAKTAQDVQTSHELESQLRANHNLSGVCSHISWDQIEKESGKPSFDDIDQTVASFAALEWKNQLCLKPGAHTPAFVYAEGAQAFETHISNRHRRNFGATVKKPVPWDPVYGRDFERIIKQLGERYARDPCA